MIVNKPGPEMIITKYSKPVSNKYLISRHRLHQKLNRSQQCKLTLVTAPAGYGKTTAVLDWLDKFGVPHAWLSLDSYDNDPLTFWQYVCAALEITLKGITRDTEYVFSSQELINAHIHINILIDRLSELSSDFFLVLDDLHLITTPSILNGLSYLIDYLPEKIHLVFISRAQPDFEVAKHRIKWQVQRLTEEDLRFGEEEIVQFYGAHGFALQNNELEAVEVYTEGWAAALVAVALSMEDTGAHAAFSVLSRSSRDIGQYLRNEVLCSWSPEKQAFAIKTSIQDTLWPDLCNAVLPNEDAAIMLNELAEGNGFLTVLDDQKQAYRHHHLFRSFLLEQLQEMYPAEIPELYTRAGCWFRDEGLIPEAIEYFLNGGVYEQAYELIEHKVDHLIHNNDFGRLISWMERLPVTYRDNSFKCAAIYANHYAETGQYDLSRLWINKMKALKDDTRYTSVPSWEAISSRNCIMTEANLLIRQGDISFASLIIQASSMEGFKNYKMQAYNDFNTADVYFYRSPISKAAALLKGTPETFGTLVENYRQIISKNPGYAPLAKGEYLYECNRLAEALPYLLKAQEEAREATCPGALVPAMVNIARIKRSGGDIAGAFTVLEECDIMIQGFGKSYWHYLLMAYRCRLNMDAGYTDQVKEWFSSSKLGIFTEISRIREFELIVYARVLILLNRTQDAEILLQRLLEFTGGNRRLHSRVEVLNLLALLAFRNHHARQAYNYLDESLEIGIAEGYVRSYLDEWSPMAGLLRSYIKSRRNPADEQQMKEKKSFAGTLLKQIRASATQTAEALDEAAAGMAANILEQLTEQEKKVLEFLADAATNQEICDELGVSLRTVKTHTGNIYSKLGVKNRAQCVKMVREIRTQ